MIGFGAIVGGMIATSGMRVLSAGNRNGDQTNNRKRIKP
jgi:hypothetical protein